MDTYHDDGARQSTARELVSRCWVHAVAASLVVVGVLILVFD